MAEGCDGLKSAYAQARVSKCTRGEEGIKGVSNCTRREEGLKLMNLERTYFLNGSHPKIVGFICFSENPLKMMNVPCFI